MINSPQFDEAAQRVASTGWTRRDMMKFVGSGLAAYGVSSIAFGVGPFSSSAAASVSPRCNPLGLSVCTGKCAVAHTATTVGCAKVCAASATGIGLAACLACLGTSLAAEIQCMNDCHEDWCFCDAPATDCEGGEATGDHGLFFGKQCCTAQEECTPIGCQPKCPPCNKRNYLIGACSYRCRGCEVCQSDVCALPTCDPGKVLNTENCQCECPNRCQPGETHDEFCACKCGSGPGCAQHQICQNNVCVDYCIADGRPVHTGQFTACTVIGADGRPYIDCGCNGCTNFCDGARGYACCSFGCGQISTFCPS
jgi:hypothetical protein